MQTFSVCVDWTQGTGLPIRGTVRKEQAYYIPNMTVQQTKTAHLACMGYTLPTFLSIRAASMKSKASEQTRISHETKVFLRYPDNLFFRGQSFPNGHLQMRDRKHVKDFLPDIILEVIIDVKPPVRLANVANPNKIELIFHLSMICS